MNLYYLLYILLALLAVVLLYDLFQTKHAIIRNFPIIGHFRYWIEKLGPELRQYIVANDKEEMPFNRSERSWIYATSKKQKNTFGFGTTEQLYEMGYPIIKHTTFPISERNIEYFHEDKSAIPCAKLIGKSHNRENPYRPLSVVNISAMSFGSLGSKAVTSLNKGALKAQCYHNTGEGGVSSYHCNGADIVWQLGTGYFGARDKSGEFSLEKFNNTVISNSNIKMIEIK